MLHSLNDLKNYYKNKTQITHVKLTEHEICIIFLGNGNSTDHTQT